MRTQGSIMRNTRIDDMSERIRIVQKESARSPTGDIIDGEETTLLEAWAKVIPMAAKTDANTTARVNEVAYRFIIRYRNTVKADDEVIWRGRRFSMTAPPYDADARGLYLVMECMELVADGQE